jgi:hypothetical protein
VSTQKTTLYTICDSLATLRHHLGHVEAIFSTASMNIFVDEIVRICSPQKGTQNSDNGQQKMTQGSGHKIQLDQT